jgi:hypothetical protein
MTPVNLDRNCSLGVFFEPVKENINKKTTKEQKELLKTRLLGSMSLYKGKNLTDVSLESILELSFQ